MKTFKLCLIALAAVTLTYGVFYGMVAFVLWNLSPAEWGSGGRTILLIFGVPAAIYAGVTAAFVANEGLE